MIFPLMASLLLGVGVLAYVNGSNDISKGIATLVGSGVTNYQGAIYWGILWTVAGSVSAAFFSNALVTTFSKGFLPPQFEITSAFVLAVLVGAIGWVAFATRTGLPVSTTHAITGALCGAAVVSFGFHGVAWMTVGKKVFVPLFFSPLISLAALWALFPAMRTLLSPLSRKCACAEIQARQLVPVAALGEITMSSSTLPSVRLTVDHLQNCEARSKSIAGIALDDGLHWISSGLTSFARGLNDAPKIVALGFLLTLILQDGTRYLFYWVAMAMGLGSLISGLRVTTTLAERITPMNALEGLSANLVTSFMVAFAARWGMPVSTTHVSSGAIIGVGLRRSKSSVQWQTVKAMLQAWIITLPASAALSVASWWIVRKILGVS